MKYLHTNLTFLLVLAFGLFATGCPKPKSKTVTGSCTVNTTTGVTTCTVGGSIVWDRPAETPSIDEDSELIVDVPDGWTLDSSSGTVNLHANWDSSQPTVTAIPMTLTTLNRDPIGTGSSTKVFQSDETAIETAATSQSTDYEAKVVYGYSTALSDCNLPTGEYTFHFRFQPPEGRATYLGALTIQYEAPTTPGCTGSANIKQ